MRKRVCLVLACGALVAAAAGFLAGQDHPAAGNQPPAAVNDPKRPADEAAIRKAVQGFRAAFEKGDAVAAAAYLTAGAELIPDDRDPIRGRDAIRKALAAHFARNARPKLTLEGESVRFLSRDTAVEEGQLTIAADKGPAETNRCSILCVREDGHWLLAAIREWPNEQESLHELDWLIGTWSAKRADAEVQTTYEWFGNRSYIKAQFTVREKDQSFTGMQLIGTDPETGALRTWIFENDGGFGEGSCERDGKHWVFESTTTLADGRVLTASNILVPVDRDTFTWQPVRLAVDGEPVPDLPPVKVTRVKNKQ